MLLFELVATKPAEQSFRQRMDVVKLAVNVPVRGIQEPRAHVHTMGVTATMVEAEALWLRKVQLGAVEESDET